jgi:hypothetical protein
LLGNRPSFATSGERQSSERIDGHTDQTLLGGCECDRARAGKWIQNGPGTGISRREQRGDEGVSEPLTVG